METSTKKRGSQRGLAARAREHREHREGIERAREFREGVLERVWRECGEYGERAYRERLSSNSIERMERERERESGEYEWYGEYQELKAPRHAELERDEAPATNLDTNSVAAEEVVVRDGATGRLAEPESDRAVVDPVLLDVEEA